jgi:ribosomal peptide maturation radical SAM protein 1
MAGEWLFSQHFHGEGSLDAEIYLGRHLRQSPFRFAESEIRELLALRALVPGFISDCVAGTDWGHYGIIGFSSMFEQNFASLSLARALKKHDPHLKVVFGGANWEAGMGEALFRSFSFVDFAAIGEADKSFPRLLHALETNDDLRSVNGILHRTADGEVIHNAAPELVQNLDETSVPDFTDYFAQLGQSPLRATIDPWLQLETSRGCWWGQKHHCTFCGLNGGTMAFRRKSPERAFDEIVCLTERWKVPQVAFVDNILDHGYFTTLIPRLSRVNKNLHMFYETKSNLKKTQIRLLASAGIREVQPGIESLSTPVLKMMRKGVSALQNVAYLKYCQQFKIRAAWNILYGFPGESPAEYRNILELMERIVHLVPPMSICPIRLDRFSPNHNQAQELGFVNVRPLSTYQYLYDSASISLDEVCYFFDFDYATQVNPDQYVTRLILFWARWRDMVSRGAAGSLFYTVASDRSATLFDSRFNRKRDALDLTPLEASLYAFCDEPRSYRQLCEYAQQLSHDSFNLQYMHEFLDVMLDTYFMAREDDTFLSLALFGTASKTSEGVAPYLELPIASANPQTPVRAGA